MASVKGIREEVLSRSGSYTTIRENLQTREVVIGDGERRRRFIVCYNPKEAHRQLDHRAAAIEYLEKELERHRDRSATAQWAIELLVSTCSGRYPAITKGDRVRKVRECARYGGEWVLEANDDTISIEDAASGYKGLMVIERCFRSLKSTQIKLTPIFHWTSQSASRPMPGSARRPC